MSTKYIEIAMGNNTKLYIETLEDFVSNDSSTIFEERSNKNNEIIQRSQGFLQDRLEQIKDFSSQIAKSLRDFDHQPDELEVCFSVGISADAGIIISKLSSEASIEVKLKWSKEK